MTGIGANDIEMDNFPLLILIATIIGLSVITANTSINFAMAASSGNGRGASVVQEQVNTGNPNLDKEINKFYSCISKTHQDPPPIQIVDNCYYQTSTGGINSGNGNNKDNHGHSHNNKNFETHSTTGIATAPPGVLVEVP